MSAEENTRAVNRAVERFNAHDLDGYLELYADALALYGYPPGVEGKEGARNFYGSFMAGFPDGEITVDDLLAEGDRMAVRFTLRGTHEGEILGVPATGRRVEVTGQSFFRFEDARIVERWQALDQLGLMVQLGAVPAPA